MLWSGHESARWACSLCQPGWRPGPDDPPEAELWEARNCHHAPPPAGAHLDLPYAPEETRCPRRLLAAGRPLIDAFLTFQDVGALPAGARDFGDVPLRIVEAFQALEAGRRMGEHARRASEDQEERESMQRALRGRSRP